MRAKILLIEDNPDHVLITKRALEKTQENYEVDSASNAREGLEKIFQQDYHVILSDFNLLGSTALDVLKEMNNKRKDTPLVVVTAVGNETTAVASMKEGAYDYILKDFSYEETLPIVIKRTLERYSIKKEKSRLEEEIRRQEAFLEKVVNSLHYPFSVINPDYTIALTNAAAQRQGVITGSYCYQVSHQRQSPCEDNMYPCPLREVLRTGRPFQCEHIHYSSDNNRQYVEVHADPIIDKEGNIVQAIEYAIDISERKKAEEALRESEGRFRLLAENVADIIWTMDMQLRFTYISPSVTSILGYSYDEVCQLSIEEILTPASYKCAMEILEIELIREQAMGKDIPHSKTIELEHRTKNGLHVWCEVSVTFIRNSDNVITGILGVSRDITDRKKAEEALRESEEKFRNVIENIGIGVALISPEMEIMALNRQMKLWFPHAEFNQETICYRIFNQPPRDDKCPYCPTYKTLQDGQLHEAVSETPAGDKVINYRIVASPLTDSRGKVVAVIEMVENITDRLRTAEVIKQADELKEAYRQLQDAQAQLVQSEKMAGIGQLASGVAHEINNPLTGILNNIQLIQMEMQQGKEVSPTDFKDILSLIEVSALRCKNITRSLLDFSRSSKGILQPFSLNDSVEKVLTLIEYELRLDNISIQKNLGRDIPQVNGDAQVMQQVILNLISNSKWAVMKRHGKEGGIVSASTRCDQEEQKVILTISDNGVGIPKENQARIFDPFFTTKPVGEGTGLGLSIVYKIISDHKGTITLESGIDQGAAFRISLPAFLKERTKSSPGAAEAASVR